ASSGEASRCPHTTGLSPHEPPYNARQVRHLRPLADDTVNQPRWLRPRAVPGAPSPTAQTIPPTDTPLPKWSGTFAPFPANPTVAPSALRTPSWRRSRDASHRSTECARLRPRARHTPLAVARSKNRSGYPTGAQIASAAGASCHSPALVADNAHRDH